MNRRLIKNKKWFNPFHSYLGIGDVFYFIAIIPFFGFINYAYFFIGSLFFSIVLFVLLNTTNKTFITAPLAGFVSILFICGKFVQTTTSIDIFHGIPW